MRDWHIDTAHREASDGAKAIRTWYATKERVGLRLQGFLISLQDNDHFGNPRHGSSSLVTIYIDSISNALES
jgi:hypothetical protein